MWSGLLTQMVSLSGFWFFSELSVYFCRISEASVSDCFVWDYQGTCFEVLISGGTGLKIGN